MSDMLGKNDCLESLVESKEPSIRIVHVIGPLGSPECPKCKTSESVEKRGSWDWGPFYWECDACDEQWGHA